MTTLTDALAQFVASLSMDRIPEIVVERAKACLLYAYGIGLGSNDLTYAQVARRAAIAADGVCTTGATIFGDTQKTTVGGAALANATLFHGRNQEDTCGSTHTGVVVIPLLTALAEARLLPVDKLLPAVVAGYEVAGVLDDAYASKTTANAFRASPLFGVIGAAAAAAKLLELPWDRVAAALSNAAAFAGGTLQSQAGGSDEWKYQVGIAARTALVAVELARAGSDSAPLAFEGRAGYAKAFARAECDVPALAQKLGQHWFLTTVAFKPYPLPAWNQTPVDVALALRDRIARRQFTRIQVYMNPYEVAYPGKDSTGPFKNETEAKLSIAFAVGTAFAHGVPTLALLRDYKNAATQDVVNKIVVVPDADIPRLSCRIVVEHATGERVEHTERRSWSDYNYDCVQVSRLIRSVGAETGVPSAAFDLLDAFVQHLPDRANLSDVINAFSLMPKL